VVDARHSAAGGVSETEPCSGDLAALGLTAQLPYDLDGLGGAGRTDGMAFGEEPAAGVDDGFPAPSTPTNRRTSTRQRGRNCVRLGS